MAEIKIPVMFQGTVTVQVPDETPPKARYHLARNYAMAMLDANVESCRADWVMVEEQKLDFLASTGRPEDDWDKTEATEVAGVWEVAEEPNGERSEDPV